MYRSQVSSAYLKFLKGPGTKILFEFVKEVPKHSTKSNPDVASLFGPLFFTWVVLLLFPVSYILLLQMNTYKSTKLHNILLIIPV